MNFKKDKRAATILLPDLMDEDGDIMPIIADSEGDDIDDGDIPPTLPVLSLRNNVLFPGVVMPISIGRPKSVNLIRDVYRSDKIVAVVAQRDPETEDPGFSDLHHIATVGYVVKLLEMPDGSTTAIIHGKRRARLVEQITDNPYMVAVVEPVHDIVPPVPSKEFDAVVGSLKDLSLRIIKLNPSVAQEASFAIKNIENKPYLINYICSNTDIKVGELCLWINKVPESNMHFFSLGTNCLIY